MDPNFRRMAYVRYADDFVIGIIGPRKLAVDIIEKTHLFLSEHLGLEMNKEKTVLTKFSKGINFLGFNIKSRNVDEKPIKLVKKRKVRVTPRISFHAPITKLLERLTVRGYFKRVKATTRMQPRGTRSLINLAHKDILLRYNAVIHGILNYYNCADNRKSLGIIIHGLKMSCALTLALKFKLKTAAKVFKKFGGKLTYRTEGKSIDLFIPKTFARINHLNKFKTGKVNNPEQAIKLSYANRITNSALIKPCVVCGDHEVELHHVHKLRVLRKRSHLD